MIHRSYRPPEPMQPSGENAPPRPGTDPLSRIGGATVQTVPAHPIPPRAERPLRPDSRPENHFTLTRAPFGIGLNSPNHVSARPTFPFPALCQRER
jgi:hypothetical protein